MRTLTALKFGCAHSSKAFDLVDVRFSSSAPTYVEKRRSNHFTSKDLKLLPLFVAIIFISAIGWVLYQVFDSATKFRDTASERMGKKNVVITKDGVRVGVKHVQNEKYVDKTQSWVVKAWNLGQAKSDADLPDMRLQAHGLNTRFYLLIDSQLTMARTFRHRRKK
ncbi:hypothetical protein E4U41_001304 [Claviceps citrina]|nr:hypothetical protein E4U41_001304 [Claviceps citrina]